MSEIRYTAGGDYDPGDSVDRTPTTDPLEVLQREGSYFFALTASSGYIIGADPSTDGIYADFSDSGDGSEMTGGDRGDVLIGSVTAASRLSGGAGDDILEGGAGGDSFNGDDGVDTVSYEHATRYVVASLAGSFPSGSAAAGDSFTAIENLRGSQFGDTLEGLSSGRSVLEGGGDGDALLNVSIASYAHSAEGVFLDLSQDTIFIHGGDAQEDFIRFNGQDGDGVIGSVNADTLVGSSKFDTYLDGSGGFDTITGYVNDDTIVVTGPWASVDGGAGDDVLKIHGHRLDHIEPADGTIANIERVIVRDGVYLDLSLQTGSVGAIRIVEGGGIVVGTQAADHISGGRGVDLIEGGGGADVLRGGEGADRFLFSDAASSQPGKADRILDFSGSAGDGDAINVRDLGFTGIQDGAFKATGEPQLRILTTANGDYAVVGDADGDGTRDFAVRVRSDAPLTADDFIFLRAPVSPPQTAHADGALSAHAELAHPLAFAVLA